MKKEILNEEAKFDIAFYTEKQTYVTNSGVKWLENYIHEQKII